MRSKDYSARLQGSRPTDMLRRMSGKAEIIQPAENTQSFGSAIRAEFPLLIGLATVAIFLVVGSRLDELTTHAVPLLGVFA